MTDQMPTIRIDLERIRSSIRNMFVTRNEWDNLICDAFDKILSAEWVKESIRVEVEKIIKEAILNIKDNSLLRQAITDSISRNLVKIFNKQQTDDKHASQ